MSMDEVTFVIRLLQDNWSSSASALVSAGNITANHNATPKFIDVRSIEPNEGRRVDVDSESVLIVYEDSASTDYRTIDYSARDETFTFTLHLRVLHRRDMTSNTFSRDRLAALYKIVRYVFENNAFRPTVYTTAGDSSTPALGDADLIKITSRNEANDRGKKLLGYKIGVEMKRFARTT
tara:strand:- start:3585 stop:4121 length:537 start_codon:yes stop_codon:yes gene_type:complete